MWRKKKQNKVDNNKFQEIIAEGKADREIITATEIRKAIKGIKNKLAVAKKNWKSE